MQGGMRILLKRMAGVFWLGVLTFDPVWAVVDPPSGSLSCSTTYSGTIQLNEINLSSASGDVRFTELYVLQPPQAPDFADWRVCVSQKKGTSCTSLISTDMEVWRNGALIGTGGSVTPLLQNDFLVRTFSSGTLFDEIVLVDGSNQVLDYLHYCNQNCSTGTWTVPLACGSVLENVPSNYKDIARLPVDGSGSWTPVDNKGGTKGNPNNGGANAPHHFLLQHDGNGITCLTEPLTIKACADVNCATNYSGDVTVTLGAAGGASFGANPVTFNGEATVQLVKTTAGSTSLSVASSVPAGVTYQCLNTSTATTSCDVTFAAVGIVIDGDDGDTAAESDITLQLANKPSNIGHLGRQQRIRAVRADDKTGACVAAVQNKTLPAMFSYTVPVAAQGLADNAVTVTGASSAALGAAGVARSVNLAFDANGTAMFGFVSADAGRYSLAVAMNLPVTDKDGNASSGSPTVPAADASNAFVVRPLAVHADASGNPQAADASGSAFLAAGEDMSMTFTSLAWGDGRDADGNGAWDACASPSAQASGLARVPAWLIGSPAASVVAPSGGGGLLAYPGGDVAFAEGATAASVAARFSDVGVIRLVESGLAGFLGEGVQVCSPNIGRFHPHHFALAKAVITPACHVGGFSYMGQPFGLEYEIEARNKADVKTANYADHVDAAQDFVRGTVVRVAENSDQGSDLAARLSASVSEPGWSAGAFHFVDNAFSFRRAASPDGPFNSLKLGVRVTDPDGPVLVGRDMNASTTGDCTSAGNCDAARVGETIVRYGRMTAERVHQFLETQPLGLPLRAEYFTGSSFTPNALDSCTAMNSPALVRLDNNQETNQVDGSIALGGGSTALGGLGSFTAGILSLGFSAPGGGNSGFADITPQLGGLPWLHYDWDGDGAYDDAPKGRASWGMYRGNRNVIYLRERWN